MAMSAKQKREAREAQLREEGAAAERAKIAGKAPPPTSEQIQATNTAATLRPDLVRAAHGEDLKPQYAGAKVIVGCKLGVSWFSLQLMKMEKKFEQNMQGGRDVTEATRVGPVVRIRGTAYPRGTPPKGFPPAPLIIEGAAMNPGIDRDFMVEWMKQNEKNPVVINKMVFIAGTDDEARGIAKDVSGIVSGLDPLDPAGKDKRITKSTRPEVSDVEPGKKD